MEVSGIMIETREINHMKCYLFRLAQTKWKLSPNETSKVFVDNNLFNYITECYDSLHLSSYKLALNDLETILENKGVTGWKQ